MDHWTVEDVLHWARSSTPIPYEVVEVFRENAISGPVLASLIEEDLLSMGIDKFIWRRQVLVSRQTLLDKTSAVTSPGLVTRPPAGTPPPRYRHRDTATPPPPRARRKAQVGSGISVARQCEILHLELKMSQAKREQLAVGAERQLEHHQREELLRICISSWFLTSQRAKQELSGERAMAEAATLNAICFQKWKEALANAKLAASNDDYARACDHAAAAKQILAERMFELHGRDAVIIITFEKWKEAHITGKLEAHTQAFSLQEQALRDDFAARSHDYARACGHAAAAKMMAAEKLFEVHGRDAAMILTLEKWKEAHALGKWDVKRRALKAAVAERLFKFHGNESVIMVVFEKWKVAHAADKSEARSHALSTQEHMLRDDLECKLTDLQEQLEMEQEAAAETRSKIREHAVAMLFKLLITQDLRQVFAAWGMHVVAPNGMSAWALRQLEQLQQLTEETFQTSQLVCFQKWKEALASAKLIVSSDDYARACDHAAVAKKIVAERMFELRDAVIIIALEKWKEAHLAGKFEARSQAFSVQEQALRDDLVARSHDYVRACDHATAAKKIVAEKLFELHGRDAVIIITLEKWKEVYAAGKWDVKGKALKAVVAERLFQFHGRESVIMVMLEKWKEAHAADKSAARSVQEQMLRDELECKLTDLQERLEMEQEAAVESRRLRSEADDAIRKIAELKEELSTARREIPEANMSRAALAEGRDRFGAKAIKRLRTDLSKMQATLVEHQKQVGEKDQLLQQKDVEIAKLRNVADFILRKTPTEFSLSW